MSGARTPAPASHGHRIASWLGPDSTGAPPPSPTLRLLGRTLAFEFVPPHRHTHTHTRALHRFTRRPTHRSHHLARPRSRHAKATHACHATGGVGGRPADAYWELKGGQFWQWHEEHTTYNKIDDSLPWVCRMAPHYIGDIRWPLCGGTTAAGVEYSVLFQKNCSQGTRQTPKANPESNKTQMES